MSDPFQLVLGTYTFPNKTFELLEHTMDIDTPVFDVRRRDGGEVMDGFLRHRTWRINGKVYGDNEGSVHNDLNTLYRSVHNGGVGASFFYLSDRYAFAQLAPGGILATPLAKGLYRFAWNIDIVLVSNPFAESVSSTRVSGSRTNNSAATATTPGGNFNTYGLFTFVASGASSGTIRVDNVATSLFFQFTGGLSAGQTLIVDCIAGCVLRQVGLTMVDALSLFGGNLSTFFLKPGVSNSLIINAPTLSFTLDYRDRYYV